MRLRNKPKATEYLLKNKFVINDLNKTKKVFKKNIFSRNKKLNIEIGMGKGKFIFQKASENPNINYIGIEKEKSVTFMAAKKFETLPKPINNLMLFNGDVNEIENWFKKSSIDKIYINFPDPWPKLRNSKRRLTYFLFLDKYWNILNNNGEIEFKTDQEFLYHFTIEQVNSFKKFKIIENSKDLHLFKQNIITTEYETRFLNLGHKIYYLKLIKA